MPTALLLIDIQADYLEGGTMTLMDADKACENEARILQKFMQDQPVMQIQHIAIRPDATFFLPGTKGATKDFGFNYAVIDDACTTRDLAINGEVIKAAEVHKAFLA